MFGHGLPAAEPAARRLQSTTSSPSLSPPQCVALTSKLAEFYMREAQVAIRTRSAKNWPLPFCNTVRDGTWAKQSCPSLCGISRLFLVIRAAVPAYSTQTFVTAQRSACYGATERALMGWTACWALRCDDHGRSNVIVDGGSAVAAQMPVDRRQQPARSCSAAECCRQSNHAGQPSSTRKSFG